MNMTGSTALTHAIEAAESVHGNHQGRLTVGGISRATQNGSIAATYPPTIDLKSKTERIRHSQRVNL